MRGIMFAGALILGAMSGIAQAAVSFTSTNSVGTQTFELSIPAASAFFGDTVTGTFIDTYVFDYPETGTISGDIATRAISLVSKNIEFGSITLNGKAFDPQFTGISDYWTIDAALLTSNTLIVSGQVIGGAASYSGSLAFATAVPEPASWVFMGAGFALVGGAMRRKKFERSASFA